jgi:hypothetical protein
MSAPPKRPQTLNLTLGGKIFPIKKTVLFEKCGLFQDNPSLLGASEYEVQTKVSAPILSDFVRILEGSRIEVSSTNFKSFRLLAKEFDFKPLSKKCAAFSALDRHFSECSEKAGFSEGESLPCVMITAKNGRRAYDVLRSLEEIREFAIRLRKAYEGGIVIDGIDGGENVVEQAIATVYSNIRATFGEGETGNNFSVLFFWELYMTMSEYDIDSQRYCLNHLHEIAPTSVDVARHLLMSQCDPSHFDDFVPVQKPNWGIVGSAIRLLQNEKNGRNDERVRILQVLKAHGRYASLLGN